MHSVDHNEFKVEFLLGEGKQASVYCSRHIKSNEQYAIKVINLSPFPDS